MKLFNVCTNKLSLSLSSNHGDLSDLVLYRCHFRAVIDTELLRQFIKKNIVDWVKDLQCYHSTHKMILKQHYRHSPMDYAPDGTISKEQYYTQVLYLNHWKSTRTEIN